MRSEKDLHTAFSAWLKRNGFVFFHSRMDQRTSQVCGDPDYVVCKGNRAAFVELKWGKNLTSPAQNARFLKMARAGCGVHISKSLEDAVAYVESQFGSETPQQAPEAQDGCVCGEINSRNCPCPDQNSEIHRGGSNGADQFNPESAPKLYQVQSRLGPVVVRYEDKKEIYVRMASALDRLELPAAIKL